MAAARKLFSQRPDYLISDFFKHLKSMGDPCSWVYHTHAAPPPEGIEVLISTFTIPKHFVALKGKARCPICSADHPKYETGRVLWSSITHALYCVGHCCGYKYFSDGSYQRGIAAEKRRAARRGDENFLWANWTMPGAFLEVTSKIAARVRAYDKLARAIRGGLTANVARNIFRNAASNAGYLTIAEQIDRAEEAQGGLNAVHQVFGEVPLQGFEVLRGSNRKVSAEGRLHQATVMLQELDWRNEETAVEWISTAPDDDLAKLSSWFKAAEDALFEVSNDLQSIQRFLDRGNLKLLSGWLDATGQGVRLIRESDAHLVLWRKAAGLKKVLIPDSIWGEAVSVPMLKTGEEFEVQD